ncbi:amidase family protein [Teratosphaeria destructans]|uniref:Amidase family protein n=1 Tax=Teratosphaeria destructans TaxID=418781 RepID=A0A9W7SVZ7_9PEZI|nr:amidase family protein [Teratosphaeria destructans]
MGPSWSNNLRMPRCRGTDIEELSISQLQCHLAKHAFTSADLTACYLERINLINPKIKAVIETNPDALQIARTLDVERANGIVRSQIHGIPFLVKDNIATNDKMQTTAGSAALVGSIVPNDAPVVALLRAAGGILLGKANMSEWASMRASYYAEGYSSRGGLNRSPYDLSRHPGGSSSGSASSVATNMCAFSIGTETDGSIMFPADRNAVVGIKPTVGLTSCSGVIPECPSMDTVGCFGRSVKDVAIVLDIIADSVRRGQQTHLTNAKGTENERAGDRRLYVDDVVGKEALRHARFGLPNKRIWESAGLNAKHAIEYHALCQLIDTIRKAGAEVVDVEFPSAEEIASPSGWDWEYAEGRSGSRFSEFEVVRAEFYQSVRSYLQGLRNLPEGMASLEDIVAYNIRHNLTEGGIPGTLPPWPTGQDNFERCVESRDSGRESYEEALQYILRKSRDEGIDAALEQESGPLDGLLVPLQADGGVACSVAAKAGYPMITVPVGVNDEGMPFGIGIMHSAWNEHSLIRCASAIEDLTGSRPRPHFKNIDAINYDYVGSPPTATAVHTP